jgi:hypothetical protein
MAIKTVSKSKLTIIAMALALSSGIFAASAEACFWRAGYGAAHPVAGYGFRRGWGWRDGGWGWRRGWGWRDAGWRGVGWRGVGWRAGRWGWRGAGWRVRR